MKIRTVLALNGLVLCLAAFSLTAWGAPPQPWDGVNSPTRLESDFVAVFGILPLSATVPVEHLPYADSYWPSNRGGIAYRWNSKEPLFAWADPHVNLGWSLFQYHSPTREEAKKMSREELAQLSPTEKYDLLRGLYDYPLTRKVLRSNSPSDAYWEGICHGWAPASVNHSEPLPIDAFNPDGILIPFGSADVKALLDYMYGTVSPWVRQMGKRCRINLERTPFSKDRDCADVNAGAFHIVLTNYIALRGVAFVADVDRGVEVWNNPIFAYESKVLEERQGAAADSAHGTVRRVLLETTVLYASDDERFPPQWEPTTGNDRVHVPADGAKFAMAEYSSKYRYESETYQYWIELDGSGRIIGGDWVSANHPDYIWTKPRLEFTGDFAALKQIYLPKFSR